MTPFIVEIPVTVFNAEFDFNRLADTESQQDADEWCAERVVRPFSSNTMDYIGDQTVTVVV